MDEQFSYEGLYRLLEERRDRRPEGSYTKYMFEKGLDKILKKVGEECTEVIIAAKAQDHRETVYEIADLAYHVMVLMVQAGISLEEVRAELAGRHMTLGTAHGFSLSVTGYPGWPGDRANPLAAVLGRVWWEQTGRTLELSAVHVGLEPSVFRAKAPGLVMASAGPDILDAHSVDERAPLDGLPITPCCWPGRWRPFRRASVHAMHKVQAS